VVLDDVLAHIISDGYDDTDGHKITLDFEVGSDRLKIVISNDGRELDPLSRPAVNAKTVPEDMELTEVEVRLIHQFTDDVSYVRSDGQNILTLSFRTDGATD
jgi:anti-sigma regulatory factor (Ser/Thr protein kinase)